VFFTLRLCAVNQTESKTERQSREMIADHFDAHISTVTIAHVDRPVKTKCNVIADMSPVCI